MVEVRWEGVDWRCENKSARNRPRAFEFEPRSLKAQASNRTTGFKVKFTMMASKATVQFKNANEWRRAASGEGGDETDSEKAKRKAKSAKRRAKAKAAMLAPQKLRSKMAVLKEKRNGPQTGQDRTDARVLAALIDATTSRLSKSKAKSKPEQRRPPSPPPTS